MASNSDAPNEALTDRDKYLLTLQSMKNERASWDPHWAELSAYMLPRSGRFFSHTANQGGRSHNNIYDNTATRAVRVLGAGLMSGASSPTRPWLRLAVADPELMDFEPVKVWLSDVTQLILDMLQRSNTYRTFHLMYEELGVFGTACSLPMDDFDKGLHHYPQTIGEYSLALDERRNVNTLAREMRMTVRQVMQSFGNKTSQTVKNLYDRGNLNAWVDVVHIIEPRTDRDPSIKNAQNMPWSSVYFEPAAGGLDARQFLRVSGFEDFRVLSPRWSVMSNDIYGSPCPGMEALGDTKQLQHEQVRKGECIDYQTRPPLQVPSRLKGQALNRLPGGVSYYDQVTPQGGVRTMFEVNLDLNHLLTDIQDVRERIRSSFYTDLFLMLSQIPRTNMTATEVVERHEEKLLMLGPVLERLHNELLEPMVDIAFKRMLTARGPNGEGILPPPPPELEGQELKVEFISTLAQAQRAIDTTSIDRWTGSLGIVAQLKPNVLDKFNEDKWAELYGDRLGIDPELIVADDKVAIIREQRAQQQQAAQQAAMLAQGAQTAQQLSQTDTGGKNALTDVMKGAQ